MTDDDPALLLVRKALVKLWEHSRFDEAATLEEYLELVSARMARLTGITIVPTPEGIYEALVRFGIIKAKSM